MMRVLIGAGLVLVLIIGGCGDDGDPGVDSGPGADSGGGVDSGGEVDTGVMPIEGCPPDPPYQTAVGRNYAPWTLRNCADDTEYAYYNDDYCRGTERLTLVSIAAGWCGPCRLESAMIEEQITQRYLGQVRVIQAVVQDEEYRAPTQGYCQSWASTYGLVSNIEVYDTMGTLERYFPDGVLPATLLIDKRGVIRFREGGVSMDLITLRGAIDNILAEEMP